MSYIEININKDNKNKGDTDPYNESKFSVNWWKIKVLVFFYCYQPRPI